MRQRSRRKPCRIDFDHLEVRNLLAGGTMAVVQDFDSTGLGQLPQGWVQYENSPGAGFNVLNLQAASKAAPSGTNGLGFAATTSGDRGWVSPPDAFSDDVQVSLAVRPTTGLVGVFARASGQNGPTPTFYALEIQSGPNLQLVKDVSGVRSVIKSVSGTSSDLSNDSEWVNITLAVSGGTLKGSIYRPSTGKYLTAQGDWSASPSWALDQTDTGIASGSGVGIVRDTSSAGTVYADDFRATNLTSADMLSTPAATAAPVNSASFIALDTTTQGNWKGAYGSDGFDLAQDPSGNNPSLPSYATVSLTGAMPSTWNGTTTDPRAPQPSATGSTGRIAAAWFAWDSFSIDVHLNDGLAHRVALYAMDWDNNRRTETVEVIDSATGAVLDTRSLANFQNGVYLVWNLRGDVRLKVTDTGPTNAVATALFFGNAVASASFVTTDTTTQGNWKGAYGSDGFDLAQDPSGNNPSLPSYATVSLTGAMPSTWNGTTTDRRLVRLGQFQHRRPFE
jgi:hypothetical protein